MTRPPLLFLFLFLPFLLPILPGPSTAHPATETGDCGTHCNPIWAAINGCYKTGSTATQLSKCICKVDTNWDADITPCVLCMSTYGSAGQLSTLLEYQTQINCGTSLNTTTGGGDIYFCDSSCGTVWKTESYCGDTDKDCVWVSEYGGCVAEVGGVWVWEFVWDGDDWDDGDGDDGDGDDGVGGKGERRC
ncbi:hypothetical protein B0T19DRAFT_398476 [Cercophora scortea]|uniref:Uncharacterized protein n=1 Tax=Cercophora scortea TaxID=314031 RepID=A0AAE0MHU4_9PEZI|nr:hypothetical protein B0T19DRAFT_398476 [Cercophora scortea]